MEAPHPGQLIHQYWRPWQMAALSVWEDREDLHDVPIWQYRDDIRNLCQPELLEHLLNVCNTWVHVLANDESFH
jgi:hypothetical protein